MQIIKPPNKLDNNYIKVPNQLSIFLAGSIEMGKAIDWQSEVEELLKQNEDPEYYQYIVYNPRRTDWDSSWIQSIDNSQFNEQVNWELNYLERSDIVLFNFIPGTQSPITLMELGHIGTLKSERCIVVCPEGFWRKGNVDIFCKRQGILQANTIREGLQEFNII